MAQGDRPLRTIKALADFFGKAKWSELAQLDVNDGAIRLLFNPPQSAAVEQVQVKPPLQRNPPEPDQPLNDADLALSPPAGMLVPPPPEEAN